MSRAKSSNRPAPRVVAASHDSRHDLLLIAGVAVAFRVLMWFFLSSTPFFRQPVIDAFTFDTWARAIVAGETFQPGAFFKPPFYPYLLSVFYRIMGPGTGGVAVLQMLAGVGSTLLLYVIGRRVFGRGVALAGALITACWPVFPFFESQLLAESWTLLLTLAALERLVIVQDRQPLQPGLKRLAVSGALLGVAALGRPNLMLLIAAWAGWAAWPSSATASRRVARAAVVVLAAAVVILPTTLRNWNAEGSPVLISANLGVNLHAGHHDGADGVAAIPVGLRWQALQQRCEAAGQGGTVASSRYLSEVALDWMRDHPGRTFGLLGRKILALVSGWEARNNIGPTWLAGEHGVRPLARWWPSTWLVLPFALCGFLFVRRRPHLGLLGLTLAAQVVAVLPFFVNARFRMPLLPLCALFASAGAVFLLRRLRTDGRRALPVLLVLVTAFALVNVDWLGLGHPERAAEDAYNEGMILHGKMNPDVPENPSSALPLYERAVALDPDFPDASFGLGLALMEMADAETAAARRTLQSGRFSGLPAYSRSAGAKYTRAEAAFARADSLVPDSARLMQVLGKTSLGRGQLAAFMAVGAFQAGDRHTVEEHVETARAHYAEARRRLQVSLSLKAALGGSTEILAIIDQSERSLQAFARAELGPR